MAARIVFDCPHPYVGGRLLQLVLAAAGAVFVVVGTLAWIVVIPLGILVVAWFRGEDLSELGPATVDVPSTVLLAFGLAMACLVLRFRSTGLRLVRGTRTFVLFLRRFGYSDATRAVTFAVTRTIGRMYRVVTLDDAQAVPLGLPPGTKWFFFGSYRLMQAIAFPFQTLRLVPYAMMAAWVLLGIDVLRVLNRPEPGETLNTVASRYFAILDTTFSMRLPVDLVRPDVPGIVAALVVVCVWPIVLAPFVAAVPLWVWPAVFVFCVYIGFSMTALIPAEQGRTRSIQTMNDIGAAVHHVKMASEKLAAPRLFVLKVASSIWRETVSRFAQAAPVAIVDLSEPSEHLLWEIQELKTRTHTRCVFIGQHDRVAPLADPEITSTAEADFPQLALLLEHDEILAYTTDWRGRRRFARALRGKLSEAVRGGRL
jgi:hypothetical protein